MILAFGLKPERFVGGEGRIDAVLEPPPAEESGVLVEALSSGIEANGNVIAIVPEWFPPEGCAAAGNGALMLDTDRVAVHETGAAAARRGGAVLARLGLGSHVPSAGVLASLLPEIEAELHVFTGWVASPASARPRRPSASTSPPGPEQRVRRLLVAGAGRPQAPRAQTGGPAAGDRAAVADGHRAAHRRHAWARGRSTAALGGLPVVRGRADPERLGRAGAPARSSRAWCVPVDVAELAEEL